MTQKIAMCVAYDGTRYHGWQKQTSSEGVQAFIETALTRMAKHPVEVHCAGRTDAGVHASKQVIHFETPTQRDAREWIHGTNFYLPPDVRILYAQSVDTHFHARFFSYRSHLSLHY
ncbi:MAG: tRNA pseudouridine(38-40) synthase TruA [Gammaproteobacteria bacterium]|nr:tRNA pseudouridine(38-40) synthase TruA [Gammaproteobacteria bacterium]